jgi:hypothetical protein
MRTSEHDVEPKSARTHTYQAYSSSCNLERLASQWYAVSHGIRSVWSSIRENNVILHQLYNETLHQNLEMCFRCSLLSSRIPRSSTSALAFLSLIKSSPTVNFLGLLCEQCHAIVRLKISPFSMFSPTVSYEHFSLLASNGVVTSDCTDTYRTSPASSLVEVLS